MAAGDVVSGLSAVGAGADFEFQPTAGVEVLITHIFAGAGVNVPVYLYDGATEGTLLNWYDVEKQLKLFINNTRYIKISNDTGGGTNIGFCGMQLK